MYKRSEIEVPERERERILVIAPTELLKIWVVTRISSLMEYIRSLRILTASRLSYQL